MMTEGYREMSKVEFLYELEEYINSLEEPIQRGEAEKLTAEEWTAWISEEAQDKEQALSAENIGWIVEKLDDDGFVKSGEMYQISMNPYMDDIAFRGSLEEAKKEADEMVAYNQYDIIIRKGGEEVTSRRWCGIAPSEEDEDGDIIWIGDGFYADWT